MSISVRASICPRSSRPTPAKRCGSAATFETGHPVLMAMVYYTCPNLCNYNLNGIMEAMKNLKWKPGQDFQLVAVSMNPNEGPDVASKKKANYLKAFGHPETAGGWHFLTGSEENVKKLAAQLGFKYKWIPDQKQYAHTSVSYVLTPGGTLSRYIYGIAPETQTLRMSLLEASNGKIGTVVDQVLLFCFHFDPGKNKYTLYAWNLMRIGAALSAALIALVMIPVWLKKVEGRQLAPADLRGDRQLCFFPVLPMLRHLCRRKEATSLATSISFMASSADQCYFLRFGDRRIDCIFRQIPPPIRKRKGRVHLAQHNAGISLELYPVCDFYGGLCLGLDGLLQASQHAERCSEIAVEAQKWNWTFAYKNGRNVVRRILRSGRPGREVGNDFERRDSLLLLPAFRNKQDVVPGRYTALLVSCRPDRRLPSVLRRILRRQHSGMMAKVHVVPRENTRIG